MINPPQAIALREKDARAKPILFSAPMVRAILDGRKTQTRRIVKGNKHHDYDFSRGWVDPSGMCSGIPVLKVPYKHKNDQWEPDKDDDTVTRLWPRYAVEDRLWVRETWAIEYVERHGVSDDFMCIRYIADGQQHVLSAPGREDRFRKYKDAPAGKVRSSIFMPRWASRISLEVTGVRVERLQDISEADARKEGCACVNCDLDFNDGACKCKANFAFIWESINGAGSWEENQWVEVYEFRRVA